MKRFVLNLMQEYPEETIIFIVLASFGFTWVYIKLFPVVNMMDLYDDAEARFRRVWEAKTKRQIQKEIQSMRKYFQKHNAAYNWHGSGMTTPGVLGDGDKLTILREISEEKEQRGT